MKRLILLLLIPVILQGCTSEVVKRESGQTPFSELNQLLIDENITGEVFSTMLVIGDGRGTPDRFQDHGNHDVWP